MLGRGLRRLSFSECALRFSQACSLYARRYRHGRLRGQAPPRRHVSVPCWQAPTMATRPTSLRSIPAPQSKLQSSRESVSAVKCLAIVRLLLRFRASISSIERRAVAESLLHRKREAILSLHRAMPCKTTQSEHKAYTTHRNNPNGAFIKQNSPDRNHGASCQPADCSTRRPDGSAR